MRIVFEFGLSGDEERGAEFRRTVVAWVPDLVKAQRKFGEPTEAILGSGDLEKIGYILHSRLSHMVASGAVARAPEDHNLSDLDSLPPYEIWIERPDEPRCLMWLDVVEAGSNPSRPDDDS